MKQGFKACVCAVVLCAELFAAGALSAYAAQEQPLPDSGMTLDTAELTLDITEGDPAPVAYLNVQAPNDYFFLIWTSSDPAVASVDGTGKVTGHARALRPSRPAMSARKDHLYHHGAQKHSQPPGAEHQRSDAYHYRAGACPDEAAEAGTEQRRVYLCAAVGQQQPGGGIGKHKRYRKGTGVRQGRHQRTDHSRAVLRCTVTVTSEIGRVQMSKNAMLLQAVGASQKLTAQAAGTKNGTMTWLSSNPGVATVSADGMVTAVGDGETMILAVTPEGRADACYVAVGAAAWRFRSEDELAETLTLTGQLPYSDGK